MFCSWLKEVRFCTSLSFWSLIHFERRQKYYHQIFSLNSPSQRENHLRVYRYTRSRGGEFSSLSFYFSIFVFIIISWIRILSLLVVSVLTKKLFWFNLDITLTGSFSLRLRIFSYRMTLSVFFFIFWVSQDIDNFFDWNINFWKSVSYKVNRSDYSRWFVNKFLFFRGYNVFNIFWPFYSNKRLSKVPGNVVLSYPFPF